MDTKASTNFAEPDDAKAVSIVEQAAGRHPSNVYLE